MINNLQMEYGLKKAKNTSPNRSVYASPPTAHSTHIFAALVLLRKPLYGLQKRHIQPERYTTFF
jgi:hypothetical protein